MPPEWISLTFSRHFSLSFIALAGLQGYIPYPHRAAVCMFELVVLLLLGHMWGSIGVHLLRMIIINNNNNLAQKEYKTRHNWLGKVFKFDHTNKWYMHNPTSVLENDTHKHLWDFDIHTDHLISARRPDLMIINKKKENLQNCRLFCLG